MKSSAHTISSASTFFAKVIYPVIWIGTLATLYLLPGGLSQSSSNGYMLLLIIGGSIFFWWTWMGLKRVRLDDKALYISNYFTEIVVPLKDVAEVSENPWWNYHPVTIYFLVKTKFGNQVTFVPRARWGFSWSHHPVVDEIRSAITKANSHKPDRTAA